MAHRRKLLVLLLLAALFAAAYYIYSLPPSESESQRAASYKKIILLGIDGMDPKVARVLMSEGELPNFETLAETGTFLDLETSNPPHSPVAWASVATGTNPGKHNIFDFIRRDPKDLIPKLALSYQTSGLTGSSYHSYLRATPFWKLTSEAGVMTSVIRFPLTFPPDQISGNMFSGLGVPDIRGRLSGYTFYTTGPKEGEGADKTVNVSVKNGEISTSISGPLEKKDGKLSPITLPMKISVLTEENRATLRIADQESSVPLGGWSDWVTVRFSSGMMGGVSGIFRAYLNSLDPFELYIGNLQMDPSNPAYPISSPKEYASQLVAEFGLYHTLGLPEETEGYGDGKLSEEGFFEQTEIIEKERAAMFWREFEQFQSSSRALLAFVFDTTDRVEHLFWEHKFVSDGVGFKIHERIREQYKLRDQLVGEIISKIADNTLLLVISDHGFSSFERAFDLNRWLIEKGYMSVRQTKEGDEGALFKNVDWKKTRAYSLGFNSLYINLSGREKHGSVPESERESLLAELQRELLLISDPAHEAKKVIHAVHRASDIYSGDSTPDGPDLVIGFSHGYRMSWQNAVGGYAKEMLSDNQKKWRGDHLIDPSFVPGVLFSNKKIVAQSPALIDIAPTILDGLGIEAGEQFDGKSLLTTN